MSADLCLLFGFVTVIGKSPAGPRRRTQSKGENGVMDFLEEDAKHRKTK